MFPFAKGSPVYPYTMRIPKGTATGGRLTADLLRELTEEKFIETRVPSSLNFAETEIWGWCWWMDTPDPLEICDWLIFGMRQWRKRPPAGLVKAIHEKRVEEAKRNGERLGKDGREALREEIERQITISTPPSIEEDAVALDLATGTVFLLNARESVRKAHIARLRSILQPVYGEMIEFVPWNLEALLAMTRPNANLPAEVDVEFMGWLAEKAIEERWLTAKMGDDEVVIGLSLDDTVRMDHSTGGDMSVKGDGAVRDMIVGMMEDEEESRRVTRLRIFVQDKDGSDLRLLLDGDGGIRKCVLMEGSRYRKSVENLEAAAFERCESWKRAALIVRALIQAFDHGPLQEWMDNAPQRMLWPGSSTGEFEWSDCDPKPSADDEQGKPF